MIDWDRIASLRAEIGALDFMEVVDMFLEEADEVIARLEGAAPHAGAEAELHFLKGSALNLGFDELARLCHDGEKLASSGGAVDLPRVIASYRASRVTFAAGLQALDSHAA